MSNPFKEQFSPSAFIAAVITFVIIVYLSGCSQKTHHLYTASFAPAGLVQCKKAIGRSCGMTLRECSDGKDYYCVTNVQESEIVSK
jgi:hypothetical protein